MKEKKFSLLNLFGKTFNITIQTALLFAGLGIISGVFYLICWNYIITPEIFGTDTVSAFDYVVWLNRFFPSIPYWYPIQGVGISFYAGYPWFSHYLVVLISKLTNLQLISVFNLLQAASFLTTAVGIFLYCWTRMRYPAQGIARQIIGIIAALFYLISPITYIWAYQWGFYAESVSYMFIMPTILFADWFIDLSFRYKDTLRKRFALVVTVFFFFIAFMTHFQAGLGLSHFIILFIIGRTLLALRHYGKPALKRGLLTLLLIFIPLAGLFLWRYQLYTDYNKHVAEGGFAGYANNIYGKIDPQGHPSLKQMLGIEAFEFPDNRVAVNDHSAQIYMWGLAVAALVLSWRKSKKITFYGILSLYGLMNYTTELGIRFPYLFGPLSMFLDIRTVWMVYRAILPITAAYGAYLIWEYSLLPISSALKHIAPRAQKYWEGIAKPAIATSLALFMVGVLFLAFDIVTPPAIIRGANTKKIGPKIISSNNLWTDKSTTNKQDEESMDKAGIKKSDDYNRKTMLEVCVNLEKEIGNEKILTDQTLLGRICRQTFILKEELKTDEIQEAQSYCQNQKINTSNKAGLCDAMYLPLAYQLDSNNWPRPNYHGIKNPYETDQDRGMLRIIPEDPLNTRYDLSGYNGKVITELALKSNVSQSQVYINQLNLHSALWNYQSSVMYSNQPINQKPGVITELAKYFGYEYILPGGGNDSPIYLYQQDPNWEYKPLEIPTGELDEDGNPVMTTYEWWKFKNPTTLTTWSTKPALLFIGNSKRFLYDQLFKIANIGVLPYDTGIIFGGKEYVDDYSLEQLQKFNAIYLEWYKYRDIQKGHDLIDTYVKNGGSVFIDTGWKYNSPDWEITGAPGFFPTNDLAWKEFGSRTTLSLDNTEIINFNPEDNSVGALTELGGNWGVSAPKDIRKDSHVLMQSNNIPLLIAREYGKGKVIWSGYNAIPHIEGFKNENQKEISLINKSLEWLLNGKPSQELNVSVKRTSPDRIVFNFNEDIPEVTTLYWRESYHPKWKAYLKDTNSTKTIDVYSAGPRLSGMRIPAVRKNNQLVYEIRSDAMEILLKVLALCTAALLIFYLAGLLKPVKAYIKYSIFKTKVKWKDAAENGSNFKVHEDPNESIENGQS